MEVTAEQIRTALKGIAEENKRDHYGLGVVREVINAIQNNGEHLLKKQVLAKIKQAQCNTQSETCTARLKQLRSVCKTEQEKRDMAKALDIPFKSFCSILKGRISITPADWGRMQPLISLYQIRQQAEKEKSSPDMGKIPRSAYWG